MDTPDPHDAGRVQPRTHASSRPPDADRRAVHVLQTVMGIACELALDLDVTWAEARDTFAATLFERAERRYGTAPRIAAALDTSLRTVKQYRHRRREDAAAPAEPTFNMRRRVLHVLERGPVTLADVEALMPAGSDVNYARSAVQSLVDDGLVVREPPDRLRLADDTVVPWYLRPELHPGEKFEALCQNFARLLGSRVTPKAAQGQAPAALMTLVQNLPQEDLRAFIDDFVLLMSQFDAKWTGVSERAIAEGRPTVLAGGTMAVGPIGPAVDPVKLAELEEMDERHLPPLESEEVPAAYLEHYRGDGRRSGDSGSHRMLPVDGATAAAADAAQD